MCITTWAKLVLQIGVALLLQIEESVAKNWDRYYKLGQLLQIGA